MAAEDAAGPTEERLGWIWTMEPAGTGGLPASPRTAPLARGARKRCRPGPIGWSTPGRVLAFSRVEGEEKAQTPPPPAAAAALELCRFGAAALRKRRRLLLVRQQTRLGHPPPVEPVLLARRCCNSSERGGAGNRGPGRPPSLASGRKAARGGGGGSVARRSLGGFRSSRAPAARKTPSCLLKRAPRDSRPSRAAAALCCRRRARTLSGPLSWGATPPPHRPGKGAEWSLPPHPASSGPRASRRPRGGKVVCLPYLPGGAGGKDSDFASSLRLSSCS